MYSKNEFAPEIILNGLFILTCVLAAFNPILFKDFLSQNFIFPVIAEMLSLGYLLVFITYIQDKDFGIKGLVANYIITTVIFIAAAAALDAWLLLIFSLLSLVAKLSEARKHPTLYSERNGIRALIWILTIFTIPLAAAFFLALSLIPWLNAPLLESTINSNSPENIGGFFWSILHCLLITMYLLKTKKPSTTPILNEAVQ